MTPIHVEQAVFASSDRGSMKGYQLVAKSAGIDRETSSELSRWSPTRMVDERPEHRTINAFPISEDRFAVTRTVVGGPEYSGRGGIQIVTLILVLRDDQFSRYLHNAILVAKTAMATGGLRLPMSAKDEKLPTLALPAEPLFQVPDPFKRRSTEESLMPLLEEVSGLLKEARRVAVISRGNPIEAAASLIPMLDYEQRRSFSFTTGLAPAISRPFQLHFLRDADAPMRHTLASQKIVSVEPSVTSAAH